MDFGTRLAMMAGSICTSQAHSSVDTSPTAIPQDDPYHDRNKIVFQAVHLLIQRNSRNHGGRTKKQGNDITTQLIRFQPDSTQL